MLRIALIAATLLLGTAAEAKPYKITMTGNYYTSYMPGAPKQGTMSFQAIVNDPTVITTIGSGGGAGDAFATFESKTRIGATFATKVDGVSAAKSFMELDLRWLTIPNEDWGFFSIYKLLTVDINQLVLPAMVQIAKPILQEQCNTAYQPYGNCTLGNISSTMMLEYYGGGLGIDTNLSVDDPKKNILDFSIGKDANIDGCCAYAEINWTETPPAGYDGDLAPINQVGTIDFGLTNFTISPVPEPASWAILITGFGMVGATMRRKTRALARA